MAATAEPLTSEQVAEKLIAQIKRVERLLFGSQRIKGERGSLDALAEARGGSLPPELDYRLDRLCERAREFLAAGRATQSER